MQKGSIYDYIRITKPPVIRFIKNISLFVASTLMIGSLVLLSGSTKKDKVVPPAPAQGAAYEKNLKGDQNKKNTIMRRFISYYRMPAISY